MSLSSIDDLIQTILPEDSGFEKAKKIYEYAVNNTRYVSIQLGEGGYEPFYASKVHKTKYGDCKALSMYTKSLLSLFDIESYYTEVFADSQQAIDYDHTFASLGQGNHAILMVPIGKDTVWAECTSQNIPFGYKSGFTSDRWALYHTPDGGTPVYIDGYKAEENFQNTKVIYNLNLETKELDVSVHTVLNGNMTSNRHIMQSNLKPKEIQKLYGDIFYPDIGNRNIDSLSWSLKEPHGLQEQFTIQAPEVVSGTGDYTLISPILFKSNLKKIKKEGRAFPFSIRKSYTKKIEYSIELPPNYSTKGFSEDKVETSKFGSYTISQKIEDSGLIINSTLSLVEGEYKKDEISNFNNWIDKIITIENQKVLISPKT